MQGARRLATDWMHEELPSEVLDCLTSGPQHPDVMLYGLCLLNVSMLLRWIYRADVLVYCFVRKCKQATVLLLGIQPLHGQWPRVAPLHLAQGWRAY